MFEQLNEECRGIIEEMNLMIESASKMNSKMNSKWTEVPEIEMKTEEAASGASEEVPSEMETSTTICESFTKLDGQIELEISQESESRGLSQFSNGSRSPARQPLPVCPRTVSWVSWLQFVTSFICFCESPKYFWLGDFEHFFKIFEFFKANKYFFLN